MPLEVPYYEVKRSTLGVRSYANQIGTVLGKEGAFTGDAGCGCKPLWWLLAAAVGGAAVGALAKGGGAQKRKAAAR